VPWTTRVGTRTPDRSGLAAAVFFFHERPNRTEVVGIALVIAGLLILVLQ
jgi:drug/metabolite transporter (DMT)-like permease